MQCTPARPYHVITHAHTDSARSVPRHHTSLREHGRGKRAAARRRAVLPARRTHPCGHSAPAAAAPAARRTGGCRGSARRWPRAARAGGPARCTRTLRSAPVCHGRPQRCAGGAAHPRGGAASTWPGRLRAQRGRRAGAGGAERARRALTASEEVVVHVLRHARARLPHPVVGRVGLHLVEVNLRAGVQAGGGLKRALASTCAMRRESARLVSSLHLLRGGGGAVCSSRSSEARPLPARCGAAADDVRSAPPPTASHCVVASVCTHRDTRARLLCQHAPRSRGAHRGDPLRAEDDGLPAQAQRGRIELVDLRRPALGGEAGRACRARTWRWSALRCARSASSSSISAASGAGSAARECTRSSSKNDLTALPRPCTAPTGERSRRSCWRQLQQLRQRQQRRGAPALAGTSRRPLLPRPPASSTHPRRRVWTLGPDVSPAAGRAGRQC